MSINNEKIPTNKNFGTVFFVVFLIIGLWPLLTKSEIRYWSLLISIVFLILGLFNSKLLTPLNKIWFRFGIFLGNFISPIVMGIVFFLVVTPTGFIMKILGKDLLNTNFNKEIKSYWINRDNSKTSMKKQF